MTDNSTAANKQLVRRIRRIYKEVFYRLENGKLMERWLVTDLYGLLEEIKGAQPPQIKPHSADT